MRSAGTLILAFLLAMGTCQAHAKYKRHPHPDPAPVTSDLVSYMRAHLGTNPTGWAHRWCGKFLDTALRATGHAGGGNLARAYARYGSAAAGPCVGCLAVWRGHVGVVSGVDANGNVIIISGNDGRTVRERARSTKGVIAWRVP